MTNEELIDQIKIDHLIVTKMHPYYQRLLGFAKSAAKQSCCQICECISCSALEVLREIGEAE